MDYVDKEGTTWIMAACGHRVGGGVKIGDKIALCPNCRFIIKFKSVPVVYPERLPKFRTIHNPLTTIATLP